MIVITDYPEKTGTDMLMYALLVAEPMGGADKKWNVIKNRATGDTGFVNPVKFNDILRKNMSMLQNQKTAVNEMQEEIDQLKDELIESNLRNIELLKKLNDCENKFKAIHEYSHLIRHSLFDPSITTLDTLHRVNQDIRCIINLSKIEE